MQFPPADCAAGNFMTDNGCQQCGANTYSGDAADSCTDCPDGKISDPGSTTIQNCQYGKNFKLPHASLKPSITIERCIKVYKVKT